MLLERKSIVASHMSTHHLKEKMRAQVKDVEWQNNF